MHPSKNLSESSALQGGVCNALRVTGHKKSMRQVNGYVDTVATKLKTYHAEKPVRDRYHLLLKCDRSVGTLLGIQSLILQCQEIGAWGVKHKAQALYNTIKYHLKNKELVEV